MLRGALSQPLGRLSDLLVAGFKPLAILAKDWAMPGIRPLFEERSQHRIFTADSAISQCRGQVLHQSLFAF
jgi:hypothetical protein